MKEYKSDLIIPKPWEYLGLRIWRPNQVIKREIFVDAMTTRYRDRGHKIHIHKWVSCK
jgi:hypothetical protein